ncbi:YceI family protein [Haloferula sargassicola]|uniref:Protein YceI n=1 Tax=Haloferula sargassicola TaxID=490096 RepID=A0ABP9USQ8_9BACT
MKHLVTTLTPAALAAFALVSCENPADKTTDATVKDAAPAAATNGTRYVIADGSTITFVGSKVTGSHDGGFKDFDGFFTVGPDGDVTGGTITIDMNSTWTDTDKLTEHLKSGDFFLVGTHPESKFTITGVEKTGTGYEVSGNLLMRGVEKNVTFPATGSKDGDAIKVQAEFDINRKDWGIVYAGKADDLIRDEVVIRFDLTAEPEA